MPSAGNGTQGQLFNSHSQQARIKDINSQGKLEDKAEEMLNIHFPLQFSYYLHSGNIINKTINFVSQAPITWF